MACKFADGARNILWCLGNSHRDIGILLNYNGNLLLFTGSTLTCILVEIFRLTETEVLPFTNLQLLSPRAYSSTHSSTQNICVAVEFLVYMSSNNYCPCLYNLFLLLQLNSTFRIFVTYIVLNLHQYYCDHYSSVE